MAIAAHRCLRCRFIAYRQLLRSDIELGSGCLQDASARVAEVEAAAERASRELAEYKAESAELRNQDLTIRRLEERVRGLEADLQEKVHLLTFKCPACAAAGAKSLPWC